jgi:hypothetical protein
MRRESEPCTLAWGGLPKLSPHSFMDSWRAGDHHHPDSDTTDGGSGLHSSVSPAGPPLVPQFWQRHVAGQRIGQWDVITCRWDDGSRRVELLVLDSNPAAGSLAVHVLSDIALPATAQKIIDAGNFLVAPSRARTWKIIRKLDRHVMRDGIASQQEAHQIALVDFESIALV